jgi:hypothetical protein
LIVYKKLIIVFCVIVGILLRGMRDIYAFDNDKNYHICFEA